jgi:hypothetical protein
MTYPILTKSNKPSLTKKKLPINSPFCILEKVESMICVAVSSVGEDKEEPTDLLKACPNLVA